MRVTVGTTLLGTSPDQTERLIIGGLSASASTGIQEARGECNKPKRLRINGDTVSSFSVPTVIEFESVAQAQKYIFDTSLVGAVEGALSVEYGDGSSTTAPWAVATPSNLTHTGVTVFASWSLRVGSAFEG